MPSSPFDVRRLGFSRSLQRTHTTAPRAASAF